MDAVKMALASIEELQAVIQQTDPLQVEALKSKFLQQSVFLSLLPVGRFWQ